jgi:hypothetical protein
VVINHTTAMTLVNMDYESSMDTPATSTTSWST